MTTVGQLADRLDAILSAGIRSSGSQVVNAEQSTGSDSYALLGTPDRVEDIVLPEDGLLFVVYQALVSNVGTDGAAAIFLNGNQLKVPVFNGVPVNAEALFGASDYDLLTSSPGGLVFRGDGGGAASLAVTSGVTVSAVGDDLNAPAVICPIWADAGTYDVSVRFKVPSGIGDLSAKFRKLWVWSMAFGLPPA